MFLSYTISVIMVSLSLYGLWYLCKDIWNWFMTMRFVSFPDASFLIVIRNQEHEVEDLIRFLTNEMSESGQDYDAVVVDCASDDLTPTILQRLAAEMPCLTVVNGGLIRPVADALPLCRGNVIHVLDLTNRLRSEQFMAAVSALVRQNQRSVTLRGKAEG